MEEIMGKQVSYYDLLFNYKTTFKLWLLTNILKIVYTWDMK